MKNGLDRYREFMLYVSKLKDGLLIDNINSPKIVKPKLLFKDKKIININKTKKQKPFKISKQERRKRQIEEIIRLALEYHGFWRHPRTKEAMISSNFSGTVSREDNRFSGICIRHKICKAVTPRIAYHRQQNRTVKIVIDFEKWQFRREKGRIVPTWKSVWYSKHNRRK